MTRTIMFKRTVVALTLLVAVTVFTGCRNTAHGMGRDVERAGEKIQEKTE